MALLIDYAILFIFIATFVLIDSVCNLWCQKMRFYSPKSDPVINIAITNGGVFSVKWYYDYDDYDSYHVTNTIYI